MDNVKPFCELSDALKGLISVIDAAGLDHLSNGVQLGRTVWYVKASDALNAAKRAIEPTTTTDKEKPAEAG